MEESHQLGLPFDNGVKSLWKLVVGYKKKGACQLEHHKKKVNLGMLQIPEALESQFTRPLRSERYHAPLFMKFCVKNCDFMHINCGY